ncbi:MAG: VCBS repeat-containing protein [Prolixibacteraceae bacterium]|nr:VCBS repeat-containing protein [Prolixibacteraceae bacterium]
MKQFRYLFGVILLLLLLLFAVSCSKDNSFQDVDIIVEEPSALMLKSAITGIPCPGDFNGDGKVDLAQKDGWTWSVDYANPFNQWDFQISNIVLYRESSLLLINDFDRDGKDDVFVIPPSGYPGGFYIDYAWNGFGQIDLNRSPESWINYSGGYFASGDYNGDGYADLSYKDSNGNWSIDYSPTATSVKLVLI